MAPRVDGSGVSARDNKGVRIPPTPLHWRAAYTRSLARVHVPYTMYIQANDVAKKKYDNGQGKRKLDDSAGSSAGDAKRQARPDAGVAQAEAPAASPAAPTAVPPAAALAVPPPGPAVPPTATSSDQVVEMDPPELDAEASAAVAPSAEQPTESPATSNE